MFAFKLIWSISASSDNFGAKILKDDFHTTVGLAFNTLFGYNLMMSSIIAKMYNFKAKYPKERKDKKKKKNK
jgi:hypothetical protein